MALYELLARICGPGRVFANEPMKNHTSFGIGGPADLLVLPGGEGQALEVLRLLARENTPCLVIGNGTNLLVSDGGIEGVVMKLARGFDEIDAPEDSVIAAQSGVLLSALADAALAAGLAGLEFASGIPGSLGGAVFMNAGAFDGEMRMVVRRVRLATVDGRVITVSGEDMAFGYRSSLAQATGAVVLKAWLALSEGDPGAIKAKMLDLNARRAEKQPLDMPSAGSAFKRPEGYFAGKLIMDSGLRGFSIGGAQVSAKHCGFIVNKGGATARDVLNLIEHVKRTVYEKFGVELEEEIRCIGRA